MDETTHVPRDPLTAHEDVGRLHHRNDRLWSFLAEAEAEQGPVPRELIDEVHAIFDSMSAEWHA